MKEYALSAFLITLLALLSGGCFSIDVPIMNPAIHGYSGPERPLEDLAVVIVFAPGGIRVTSIDGPAGPVAEAALLEMTQTTHDRGSPRLMDQLHLPSGYYTINCAYAQTNPDAPTRDQLFGDTTADQTFPVPADLLAGQVYFLIPINDSDGSLSLSSPGSVLKLARIGSVQELAPEMSADGGGHEWVNLNQRMSAAAGNE